ncbi:glycosyltransferase family 4 protein [Listeria booriae]|uniref:glycosyltransferase family 4 protein n=1 Tax=Listeria booriae TaxID=1552123 RepID=UPI001624490F|nr:glycosyltransferase family 4 protein [Listeria booriae]MBC2676731.1 glycosyltransferase family 4 protein [Listeria booriae]
MKAIYIHQYYQETKGATRSYHFSKGLREANHDVTVITGLSETKIRKDGAKIISTKTRYTQKMRFVKRIMAFVHFILWSMFYGLKERNPDIIIASSTPLTVGIIGVVLSKIKRCPFVFEVRDVWPDIPIELGFIRQKWLATLLKFLEKWIYKHASHIIVLSEPMKQNLMQKKVPPDKITVIENLSDTELAQQLKHSHLDDTDIADFFNHYFVVAHTGTMGYVNGVDYFAEIAKEAAKHNIAFLLIGEGSEKQFLVDKIAEQKLDNIRVLGTRSKDEIYRILHHADVGAMTVINKPILWDNSANKFFDYLAIGLPVILNYQGWQNQVLEKYQAGKGFAYHDQSGFIDHLVKLKNDKHLYIRQSENAKILGEKYSIGCQFQKFLKVLEEQR